MIIVSTGRVCGVVIRH